jgi:hypothetical protein
VLALILVLVSWGYRGFAWTTRKTTTKDEDDHEDDDD